MLYEIQYRLNALPKWPTQSKQLAQNVFYFTSVLTSYFSDIVIVVRLVLVVCANG